MTVLVDPERCCFVFRAAPVALNQWRELGLVRWIPVYGPMQMTENFRFADAPAFSVVIIT